MKKQVKKRKKLFCVNVVIAYYDKKDVSLFRQPLHEILKHIAWLHSLDYAITTDHPFELSADFVGEIPNKGTDDLIYLRSGDHTQIEAKDLRNIISCIVDKSILSGLVVEMFCQNYKALLENPFPKVFYRPLNFPFVEKHGVGDPKLLLTSDYIYDVLDSEIDSSLN